MAKYNRQPLQAPPLGANVTDHEFATGYFQGLVAAVMSGFLGTARSAQSAQGHLWSKVASGGVSLVFFDGDTDHEWAQWTLSDGLVVSADKLGGEDGDYYADIPARLGYTPVRQGGGAHQSDAIVRIGWSDAEGESSLRLQVGEQDYAGAWPIGLRAAAGSGWTADSFPKMINGVVTGAEWFRSETGGMMRMASGNHLEFNWWNGFHYRIDTNTYVLINSSPSDVTFKEILPVEDDPLDFIRQIDPIHYEAKAGIPISMPDGARWGFSAQDLQEVAPSLVQEVGIPGAPEMKRDENGDLELDEEGRPIPVPVDRGTYLALSPDAQYQLLAQAYRAIRALDDRITILEAGV